jgi:hypothetical protein
MNTPIALLVRKDFTHRDSSVSVIYAWEGIYLFGFIPLFVWKCRA